MQVRHILSSKGRDIVAIMSGTSLEEAARILSANRIGAVIVKDEEDGLAGIFSERDLVHAVAVRGMAALGDSVDTYMAQSPVTCVESDSVDTIMEVMTRGRFRHVPVMDGDCLCGMISIGDVVKTRIAETVSEAAALRDYISATV